jgi:hypothetical protein
MRLLGVFSIEFGLTFAILFFKGHREAQERLEPLMTKIDFKKTQKALYLPSAKTIELIDVPPMQYAMIDGKGPPGNDTYIAALGWLYPVSYGIKFRSKLELKQDYVVPPLEGLWWAEDYTAYTSDRRDEWLWTMMIRVPDWINQTIFDACVAKAAIKLGNPPATLRLETLHEGQCAQIMHIGPYKDEGPTIAKIHYQFIPDHGLIENGNHHEIYLGDPRKTAPEKLRTVLRQPVRKRETA